MGQYNPHAPIVLGNEWVPIVPSPYSLDLETERGTTFTIPTSTVVVSGGIYIDEVQASETVFMTPMMAIYRAGEEHLTGPVKKLVIPISDGNTLSGTISSANGIATDLRYRADRKSITLANSTTGAGVFSMYFDADSYSAQLAGKRILNVDFIYTASGTVPDGINARVNVRLDAINASSATEYELSEQPEIALSAGNIPHVFRIPLGNICPFTGPDLTQQRRYPWTYADLQRFESSHAQEIAVVWSFSGMWDSVPPGDEIRSITMNYAALEVTYCAENRLAFGGRAAQNWFQSQTDPYVDGLNRIQLRTAANSAVTGVTLTPGDYTVTVTLADATPIHQTGDKPVVSALQQLYPMIDQTGVQIIRNLNVNGIPTRSEIDILPQLSLHTATAAVTGVHSYGEQIGAPVYNGMTVTQDVTQISGGASVEYTQVRFYARRFADTDVDLTIERVSDSSQTATITVDEFDLLPEIVDGWREVTLTLESPATFDNTGTTSEWRWSATGLSVGNQWQILAADAAGGAASGVFNIDSTTYGAAAADLNFEGATDDSADAVIIFSQEPAVVADLTVEQATQSLTVGTDTCGLTPDCIPTGITYNVVTWTPVAGYDSTTFGGYELQRYDEVDDEWYTVMVSSNVDADEFHDYEARVGVETLYRIRMHNVLDFYGEWSTEVSTTITAPGVTGVGDGNSVLIFTSNNALGVGNLAYIQTWDSNVSEPFTFPEAENVVMRQRYGRDYVTAFRPTERGGEQFSRSIITQNIATTSGRITDGFTALRNLVWSDVPYICVRNELSDRWYATITVPSGVVSRNRRQYVARIDVVQVTNTPSQTEIT